ncbi:Hint domain-containing protein [Leisingera aquaemixtae]|uniref:Hint domain-containing protein n=1 Tax=Leisingera aquaemixtae TaxID=1396826 RepID=UPI0021A6F04F|nr:Hint domain-containing protein [Leisingera aquaemixtae]UWQ38553.1 Hint domain-containing protein [Leisingera aquaemixtae]
MATYDLLVFSWNDVFPSLPQTGTATDLVGETFALPPVSGDVVEYIDQDTYTGSFGDHGFVTNRIRGEIDGTSVDNGMVNPEYSYFIYDSNGQFVGEMYAITLNNNNLSDIEAFTFDFRPIAGETYTISGMDGTPATSYSNLYICFASGTLIETAAGRVPVENLQRGDLVLTRDNGLQPLIWTGSQRSTYTSLLLNQGKRPILIQEGALGPGVPDGPLIVSPQHRILVRSTIVRRMFTSREVLVPAKKLLGVDGVEQIVPGGGVTYHHILCAGHEIVTANGCLSETLFLGAQAVKTLTEGQLAEIEGLSPGLIEQMELHPAACAAAARLGKACQMVRRHRANCRPLQPGAGFFKPATDDLRGPPP